MAGGLPSQQHKKKTCLSVTLSIMAMANALCAASADGNVELTKALIERGTDVNLKSNEGFRPLCLAAFWGYSDVAKVLLAKGADVNARNSGTNWTACHCAAFQGHGKVIMTLMNYNPKLDIKDELGRTAIDFASALDSIWPHFAAKGCKRTSKSELIRLKIVTKVSPSVTDSLISQEDKAYFSRPGSAYVVKAQQLNSRRSASNAALKPQEELSGKAYAAFQHGDVLTETPTTNQQRTDSTAMPRFSAWRT